MLKLILLLTLALLINLQSMDLCAQKIKVTTTSVGEVDNKLVIKYDLNKSNEKQHFNISLQITGNSGIPISIKSLSGDIGDSISGGMNKQIIWDYNADGIVLQEEINIEVFASLIKSDIGLAKPMILSAVLPGLGLFKIKGKGPYWLMGLAGYGCIGASVYLNMQANDNYSAYINNTDDEMNDGLLSKSQNQNKLSKTLAYSAIGVWGISLVWTALKAKNHSKNEISQLNNKQLYFCSGINPMSKSVGFILKFRF